MLELFCKIFYLTSPFFTALYIAQLPMEMIVVAGDNVTIDCSPSDPIINVNVTFSPLDTTVQELLTNAATYDIPSITRSSSGIYECFGYAPWSDTFTTDFISTEMVALTVLPGMGWAAYSLCTVIPTNDPGVLSRKFT